MVAGRLRYRATFQSPAETADGTGQPIPAWVDGSTVWADYIPEGATEREVGGQVRSVVMGVVQVRRLDGVTPKWRIKISGNGVSDLILNIVTVEPPDPISGLQTLLVMQPEAGLVL